MCNVIHYPCSTFPRQLIRIFFYISMEGVIGEDSDDDVIFAYRVTTVAIPMRDILTLVTSVPFQLREKQEEK